jgi:hypothetical protein
MRDWKELRDHGAAFSEGIDAPAFYSNIHNVPKIADLIAKVSGHSKFQEILDLVKKASLQYLDKALASERIDQETYSRLKKHGLGYMPIMREHNLIDSILTGGKHGKNFLRARTGTGDLKEPQEPWDHFMAAQYGADQFVTNRRLTEFYNLVADAEAKAKADPTQINPFEGIFTTALKLPKALKRMAEGNERTGTPNIPEKHYIETWKHIDGKAQKVYIIPDRNHPTAVWTAAAINGMDGTQLNGLLKLMTVAGNWIKAMSTTYNPGFLAANPFRDWIAGLLNSKSYPELAPHVDKIFNKKVFLDTFKALYDYAKRPPGVPVTDPRFELIERAFRRGALGGMIEPVKAGYGHASMERIIKRRSLPVVGKMFENIGQAAKAMEDVQRAMEQWQRLRIFQVMSEELPKQGFSQEQAEMLGAKYAREVTTDFSQHGLYSKVMNAYTVFAQASLTGSSQILRNIYRSPELQATIAGAMLGSVLIDAYGRAIAPEDEYGDNSWVKAQERHGDTSFIIPIPLPDGSFPRLPMPWVFNSFYRGPQMAMRHFWGDTGISPGKTLLDMTTMALNSASPIDTKGGLAQMLAPTILDPVVQLASNKNWRGDNLHPVDFSGGERPQSEIFFKNTPVVYRRAARLANSLSGGNEYESGFLDTYPSTYQLLHNTLVGNAGQFLERLLGLGVNALNSDVGVEDIPLSYQFLAMPRSVYTHSSLYAERIKEVEQAKNLEQGYKESGDTVQANTMWNSRPVPKAMLKFAETTRQEIRKLNRMIAKTDDAKQQNEYLTQIGKKQAKFNELWDKAEKAIY